MKSRDALHAVQRPTTLLELCHPYLPLLVPNLSLSLDHYLKGRIAGGDLLIQDLLVSAAVNVSRARKLVNSEVVAIQPTRSSENSNHEGELRQISLYL